jgi:hypothetical protein
MKKIINALIIINSLNSLVFASEAKQEFKAYQKYIKRTHKKYDEYVEFLKKHRKPVPTYEQWAKENVISKERFLERPEYYSKW